MSKIRQYQSEEDFVVDPEFKNWVLSPSSNANLYWEKWMKLHPEKLELLQAAREMILSISFQESTLDHQAYEEVLNAVISGGDKAAEDKKAASFQAVWPFRIAAVVSLLILAYFGVNYWQISKSRGGKDLAAFVKSNPKGQKSRFGLPDGTKVWLNSNSSLTYLNQDNKRQVILEGEAYFDVKEDSLHPFEVHTQNLITTALGTAFNVSAYSNDEEIKVFLIDGKVSVRADQNNSIEEEMLLPNEMVVWQSEKSNLSKSKIKDFRNLGWKDGLLFFQDAGLEEVVEQLENWYGVEINLVNRPIKEWKYNGEFANQDLETVLKRMSFVETFKFEINKNQITMEF